MKDFTETANYIATIECAEEEVEKYWPIIKNILDKQRDKQVEEYIFESDYLEWSKLKAIIDNYELVKETWKDTLYRMYIDYYEKL